VARAVTAAHLLALLGAAACAGLAAWLFVPQPGLLLTRLRAAPDAPGHAGADAGPDSALVAELIAATLAGGLPVPTALHAVAAALAADAGDGQARCRSPLADALDVMAGAVGAAQPLRSVPDELAPVADAVTFAAATGAPVVPLLIHAAAAVRRRRRDAAVRAAGRLAASLVMPLGLCALPGFLLLGVAPVVVRLVVSLG